MAIKKKQSKKKVETPAQIEKGLWKIFSQYIRLRDSDSNHCASCITCGDYLPIKLRLQAGHYVSRVVKSIKYDERNVHAQCERCNKYLHGEPILYRIAIIKRYGEQVAKYLDSELAKHRSGITRRFTTHELRTMRDMYTNKFLKLAEKKGNPWSK